MTYGKNVDIHESAWIAPGACVVDNVTISEECTVWYNAVVRGDSSSVFIGRQTNIQDGVVIHTDTECPVRIGNGTTIGHAAILHGCDIGDNTLIGMGAIVLNGAKIGNNCVIGAGALVTQNTVVPDGMLAFGSPAKVIRALTKEEIEENHVNCEDYLALLRENKK